MKLEINKLYKVYFKGEWRLLRYMGGLTHHFEFVEKELDISTWMGSSYCVPISHADSLIKELEGLEKALFS